jgi:hypothetical protein
MSLANIFQKPTKIEGLGLIYPVKVKDWDEFEENVTPIMYSKNHIPIEEDLPLLDRLILLRDEKIIESLCKIFSLVFRCENFDFIIDEYNYHFVNEHKQSINNLNYEELRKNILHQNILFEPKIYKSPALQKWAEKVLQARGKNSPNVTMEDMLSTVSVMSGKHYWDLGEYSIYQLRYDFNRICKIKNFESQSMMFANPYADLSKMKMEHFAENIDMYENPYDSLFKEKNKLVKINNAIQG